MPETWLARARISRSTQARAARTIAVALAAPATAPAAAAGVDVAKPDLTFSADEIEGDLAGGALILRGHVILTYERFRLTSPGLELTRTPRGIAVRGPGEVVFCPCPEPPVALGFAGGLVAPPADLVLQRPELRIGGVSVLALPWFWLRAPTRPGLLPPTLAWRGADGLLAGAGVHVPWRTRGGSDELDLNASAYVKGGVELVARLRTPESSARLRWDHLNTDLVGVDAHGSLSDARGGALVWDLDAIRGPRARAATMSLDEAARAYDRAETDVTARWSESVLAGAGARAVAPRGGSGPAEHGTWGPRAAWAASGALGQAGAFDALATMSALDDPWTGLTSLARAKGGLEIAARPSIFVTRLRLRESFAVAAQGTTSAIDAASAVHLDVEAPFVRTYDGDLAPLVHVVEPRARAALVAVHASGVAYASETAAPVALGTGKLVVAAGGARTAWGRWLGQSGGSLEAEIGQLTGLGDAPPRAVARFGRVRSAWSSRWLSWSLEAATRIMGPAGAVLLGRARFGEREGASLALHAAGRAGFEPIEARALGSSSTEAPSGGWLASEGWSGGATLTSGSVGGARMALSVDEDLTRRTLLAIGGSAGYAHPCRCVAIDGHVERRLGREGVDVWITIDLAPR